MANATWLFLELPRWYFSSILHPFSAGMLTGIPALGIVCLLVGVILGIRGRKPSLSMFMILPGASQLLVAVAGVLRGDLKGTESDVILWSFLALQLAGAGYLVYRNRDVWLAATLLAVFSLTYALFASFVATMAFTDSWL